MTGLDRVREPLVVFFLTVPAWFLSGASEGDERIAPLAEGASFDEEVLGTPLF